ncbi:MAG: hypothetical protein ACLFRK_03440 [Candidatus Nanohaloarchaea archaeon]
MNKASALCLLILFSGLAAAQQIPEFEGENISTNNMEVINSSFYVENNSEKGIAVVYLGEKVNSSMTLEADYKVKENSSIQVSSFLDRPNSSQEGIKDERIETIDLKNQKLLRFNETGYNAFMIEISASENQEPVLKSLNVVEDPENQQTSPKQDKKSFPVEFIAAITGAIILAGTGYLLYRQL